MIEYTLYSVIAFVVLWLFFINIMALKKRYLKEDNILLKIPMLFLGMCFVIYDAAFNVTVGSVMFWELPESNRMMFTSRLKKHVVDNFGWRGTLARVICMKLVEPWDPDHCSLSKL